MASMYVNCNIIHTLATTALSARLRDKDLAISYGVVFPAMGQSLIMRPSGNSTLMRSSDCCTVLLAIPTKVSKYNI